MLILSLDTTGRQATAALLEDGILRGFAKRDAMLDHSRTLLPLCQQLLEEAGKSFRQVDLYAVMAGPGSFTGIRIGMAAVKGFALAMDKPCMGISTLEAAAQGSPVRGTICVTLKARGEEVYWCLFEKSKEQVLQIGQPAVGQLPQLRQQFPDLPFVEAEQTADARQLALRAWRRALAGETQSCHDLEPVYLKKSQAERMREENKL